MEVLDNWKNPEGNPRKVNPNQPHKQNPGRSPFNESVLEDIHRKGKGAITENLTFSEEQIGLWKAEAKQNLDDW